MPADFSGLRISYHGTVKDVLINGQRYRSESVISASFARSFSYTFEFTFDDERRHFTISKDANSHTLNAFRITKGAAPSADEDVDVADADAVRARYKRVIGNYMARRADLITSNDPDISGRLTGANGGGAPQGVTGSGGEGNNTVAFAGSLSQVALANAERDKARRGAALGQAMALGYGSGARSGGGLSGIAVPGVGLGGFDVWVSGKFAHADSAARDSNLRLLNIGADYKLNPGFLIGALIQLDDVREEDAANASSVEGRGWMAGPYVAMRLHKNAVFDGRVAWGKSNNDADVFGTGFEDSFGSTRWLIKGQVTGDFEYSGLHIAPHAGILYFEDHQEDFVSFLGVFIPDQTVSLGRVTFGPKVSTTVAMANGISVTPHLALEGIWDFDKAEPVSALSGLAEGSTDDLRGRVEGGLKATLANGWSLAGEGFYDGIGAEDFQAYGGTATVSVPLN